MLTLFTTAKPFTGHPAVIQRSPIQGWRHLHPDGYGGELDVFNGAVDLPRQQMRPVILCELEDVRTEAWGYKAKDAAAFVKSFEFRWFRPLPCGRLASLGDNCAHDERNFVAVPEERMTQFKEIVDEETRS